MSQQAEVASKLREAVARLLGPPGDIFDLRRLTAGATKATWAFTAQIGNTRQALVLQTSGLASRPSSDIAEGIQARLPILTGDESARMLVAAGKAGVPVPHVRAIVEPDCGLGEGCITDFVQGETIARRILRESRFRALRDDFSRQCAEILAGIHAMDRASLPFLASMDGARQIALYRDVYDSYDHPVPVLEVAFRWAEDNLPQPARTTVTHGDFRMGNLMCNEQCVEAVLDWELACFSDPMQDLGWLCVRTWRFGSAHPVGGIGRREDLFAAYQQASGMVVDPARVHFWEVWGSIRWAVMCLIKGLAHLRNRSQPTVESVAIGRRMEEPLFDFLEFLRQERKTRSIGQIGPKGFREGQTTMPTTLAAAPDLLAVVREFLEREVLRDTALSEDKLFNLRVAINLLATVERELEFGPAANASEAERLTALTAAEGSIEEKNRCLARNIRDGAMAADDPQLLEHMHRTIVDALRINNPKWLDCS